MEIEEFVSTSIGKWTSMRSGHSLAFKQFEEVISEITIDSVEVSNKELSELVTISGYLPKEIQSPFSVHWEAHSNWNDDKSKGFSLILPIPETTKEGKMIRSLGYTENISVISNYKFSNDGTLTLTSKYSNTIAEEKIWFTSQNLRCRSSVLRSSNSKAILQTSYASEIRNLKFE